MEGGLLPHGQSALDSPPPQRNSTWQRQPESEGLPSDESPNCPVASSGLMFERLQCKKTQRMTIHASMSGPIAHFNDEHFSKSTGSLPGLRHGPGDNRSRNLNCRHLSPQPQGAGGEVESGEPWRENFDGHTVDAEPREGSCAVQRYHVHSHLARVGDTSIIEIALSEEGTVLGLCAAILEMTYSPYDLSVMLDQPAQQRTAPFVLTVSSDSNALPINTQDNMQRRLLELTGASHVLHAWWGPTSSHFDGCVGNLELLRAEQLPSASQVMPLTPSGSMGCLFGQDDLQPERPGSAISI